MFDQHIGKIRSNLKQHKLPGADAHKLMSFKERGVTFNPPTSAKLAGVMILLYPRNNQLQIAYIRRKVIEGDVHKGQISFPGGSLEPQDKDDLVITAIRETYEEIGISIPQINILGKLSPLYIPVSNFAVYPVVGYIEEEPTFVIEISELDEVLEIPVSYLTDPSIILTTNLTVSNGYQLKEVPYYNLYGDVLWGATAMITAEFLWILNQ